MQLILCTGVFIFAILCVSTFVRACHSFLRSLRPVISDCGLRDIGAIMIYARLNFSLIPNGGLDLEDGKVSR